MTSRKRSRTRSPGGDTTIIITPPGTGGQGLEISLGTDTQDDVFSVITTFPTGEDTQDESYVFTPTISTGQDLQDENLGNFATTVLTGTDTQDEAQILTMTMGTGSEGESGSFIFSPSLPLGTQTETELFNSFVMTLNNGSDTQDEGFADFASTLPTGVDTGDDIFNTSSYVIPIGTDTEADVVSASLTAQFPNGSQSDAQDTQTLTMTQSSGSDSDSMSVDCSAELSVHTPTATLVTPNTPAWTNPTNAQGAINGTEAAVANPTGLDTSQDASLVCSGIVGPSTPSGFTRTAVGIRVVHRWDLTITGAVAGVTDVTAQIVLQDSGGVDIGGHLKDMLASGGAGTQGTLLTENFDITAVVSDAQLAAGVRVVFRIFTTGAFVAAVNGNYSWQVDACHLTASYTRTGIT